MSKTCSISFSARNPIIIVAVKKSNIRTYPRKPRAIIVNQGESTSQIYWKRVDESEILRTDETPIEVNNE